MWIQSSLIIAFMLAAEAQAVVREDVPPGFSEAMGAIAQGESAKGVELLDRVIAANDRFALAYYHRGRERFRLGRIEDSVADFDRFIELEPQAASRQWERGISLYYACKYAAGAKQFEDYQTYHDQDVENSTWRYLCTARAESVAKAQANMLPIERDRRVPMMTIYELYRGQATADDVFRAAEAGEASESERKARLFYAHLYVGLHHEAAGRAPEALKHISLAAERYRIDHYMGDVARVHAERLRKAEQDRAAKKAGR